MLQPGEVVDRYVVEALLGEGGMGVVYRAKHRSLGGHYAIKVLRARTHDGLALALAEGRLQSKIRHPNVALVTDIIETPAGPALVMEYVDGPDLRTWLSLDNPTMEARLAVFDGVVQGVAAAHLHGLVHRDIKPGNVLLAGGRALPFPKVTDFGLARAVVVASGGPESWDMVGTPGYMAPEQARSPDQVDHRADVFSLGCVLYRLVCGRKPFQGEGVAGVIRASMTGDYAPPSELTPGLPDKVLAAIEGCLEPDPERRIPSCAVLREVLETGHPWTPVQRHVSGEDTWWDGSFSREHLDEVVDLDARRAEREAELRRILGAQVRARPEIQDREAWREGMIPEAWRREPEPEPEPEPDRRRQLAAALLVLGVFLGVVAGLLWFSEPPLQAEGGAASPAPEPAAPAPGEVVEEVLEPSVGPGAEPVEVVAAPPPRPASAQVSVAFTGGGDAKLCIESGTKCYTGGAVPPGTYPVWVMDERKGPFNGGSLTLEPGAKVQLSCDLKAKTCSW